MDTITPKQLAKRIKAGERYTVDCTYSDDVQIYDPLIFDDPEQAVRNSNGIMDDMEGEE